VKHTARVRWFRQIALVLAFMFAFGQVAVAQEASPVTGTPEAGAEGDAMVRAMDPKALPAGWKVPATVGHVTNYLVHEWYQNLTKGEQARASEYGINFSIEDANLDLNASLAAVDDYVSKNVDVLNFTPVNVEASGPKISQVAATGKPVICESSPTDGCTTLVSIDDYAAGYKVGVWAGNYVNENLGGKAVILDVTLKSLPTTVARSTGFIDGITSILGGNATVAQSVDGSGLKDKAVQVASDALTAHSDVNVIFGINDDSALGGMQAYEAQGLDMANLLVVGFGCEGNACKDALAEGGPYKVSAAMFPEYQGRLLIDAGVAAFNGVQLKAHTIASKFGE
jgi:ABC-type sugar transport system substrate-binding protein